MVKRLMRALDGYSARRYQYLAVSLTYLSFLVGMGAPSVIKARSEYASGAATEAETRAAMAGVETPTQEDLEIPAPAATELEPTTSEAEEVDSAAADEVKAAVSESADFGPGPGLAFRHVLAPADCRATSVRGRPGQHGNAVDSRRAVSGVDEDRRTGYALEAARTVPSGATAHRCALGRGS